MMVDRPGEVVAREELRQRLWPAGTFVDFEHSLNAAIKRLRAALGDNADSPRFVETVHRRGYRFIAPVEAAGGTPARMLHAVPLQPRKPHRDPVGIRLVVLPFANISGDPAQEYFSDGLTEEMITQIGRLCPGRLGVIARTSAMLFKRSQKSACEIGRELEVDYLLEGSVRREGDRIRISAQLIESRTETHLWAETYDRQVVEALMLQSDVAEKIAHSLAMELVPDQRAELERGGPRRTDAYQVYLKGRYHWNRGSADGVATAITFYERALEMDPDFAAAYAAMARARVAIANSSKQPSRSHLQAAREAAILALELDAGQSDAHVALGEVRRVLDWNWTLAEASYRQAIAIAPNCEAARRVFAVFLAAVSRLDEARIEVDRARDVDPLCRAVNTSGAWVRYLTGDIEEAIAIARYVLDLDPSYVVARRVLGAACLAAGQTDEAIVELSAAASDQDDHVSLSWLAHAKAVAGERDEATAIVAKLESIAANSYVPGYHFALAHLGLGNHDQAFAALSRALAERDPGVTSLAVEPRFDPLRRDPRFTAIIGKMGLPH